LIEEGVDW